MSFKIRFTYISFQRTLSMGWAKMIAGMFLTLPGPPIPIGECLANGVSR